VAGKGANAAYTLAENVFHERHLNRNTDSSRSIPAITIGYCQP
jgi:hypothetical protein